jgi:hypothetical protein
VYAMPVGRKKTDSANFHVACQPVGNLRLNHERRLVDQNSASWNPLVSWLRQVQTLMAAA